MTSETHDPIIGPDVDSVRRALRSMNEPFRIRVAARVLAAIADEFDYIDIPGYGVGGSGYPDVDETWEKLARVAADAAVDAFNRDAKMIGQK